MYQCQQKRTSDVEASKNRKNAFYHYRLPVSSSRTCFSSVKEINQFTTPQVGFLLACLITPVLPITSQISLFLLSGLHRTTVQGRNAHVPDPTKPSCAGEIYNFRICTATVQSDTCLHIVLVLTFHCILFFKSYFLRECLIPLPQRKHLMRYKRPNSVTLHFVALLFIYLLLLGIQHLKACLQVYFLQMVIVNLSEVG